MQKGYTLLCLLSLSAIALAGVPKNQLSGFKGSVYITQTSPGRIDWGSGVIIGARRTNDGYGKLCVLTSDHVIAINGGQDRGVGFEIEVKGAGLNVGSWKDRDAKVIARQGKKGTDPTNSKKWDLAVLEVSYGKVDDRFRDLQNNYVSTVDAYDSANKELSSFGYGRSGDPWNNGLPADIGYRSDFATPLGKPGTQRFWNNKVQRDDGNIEIDGYKYSTIEFDMQAPDATLRPGFGMGMPSDSGSPMFFDSSGVKVGGMAVRTKSLRGIFSANRFTPGPNGSSLPIMSMNWDKADGAPKDGGIGLKITPEIKTWIDDSCKLVVPEPGSWAVLTIGGAMLVRRRYRKCSISL